MIARAGNLLAIAFIHAGAAIALVRGGTAELYALAAALFVLRMFVITAGYHRYFAHKSFHTSRAMQLVLALLGITCVQKGPIWWAAVHRAHHAHADEDGDPHSPVHQGFWGAHLAWWMGREHEDIRAKLVPDLLAVPELRVIDRFHALGSVALVGLLALGGGLDGVLFGYCLSTVVLHHVVFSINSVTHLWGARGYETRDHSRNVPWLGLLGLGEGWHNNHHAVPGSARFGHEPWQIDLGWLGLRALAAVGLVWNLKGLPAHHGARAGARRVASLGTDP